ncbi:MAG: nucleotidyltransferase family protein [Pseudomonadota bacterium]
MAQLGRLIASPITGADLPSLPTTDEDWAALVQLAGDTRVLPALWRPLRPHRKAMPKETAEMIEAAEILNADRNRKLLEAVQEVAHFLNNRGMTPVIFKGAAHLATDLWGSQGCRLIRDIDILLPESQAKRAQSFLAEAWGTDPAAGEDALASFSGKHEAPLETPSGFLVEMHWNVLPDWQKHFLPTHEVRARAKSLRLGHAEVMIPSPQDAVRIAMLHGPIGHQHYYAPMVVLRDLLDLLALEKRHGTAIDWTAIQRHLAGLGWGSLPEITNRQLATFLDHPLPFKRAGLRARLDAWRWQAQLATPSLRQIGDLGNRMAATLRLIRRGGAHRKVAVDRLSQPAAYKRAAKRLVEGATG